MSTVVFDLCWQHTDLYLGVIRAGANQRTRSWMDVKLSTTMATRRPRKPSDLRRNRRTRSDPGYPGTERLRGCISASIGLHLGFHGLEDDHDSPWIVHQTYIHWSALICNSSTRDLDLGSFWRTYLSGPRSQRSIFLVQSTTLWRRLYRTHFAYIPELELDFVFRHSRPPFGY